MTYENENIYTLSAPAGNEAEMKTTETLKNVTDALATIPERMLKPEGDSQHLSVEKAYSELKGVTDSLREVIAALTKDYDEDSKYDKQMLDRFEGISNTIALIRVELDEGSISIAQALEGLEGTAEELTTLDLEINRIETEIEIDFRPSGFKDQLPTMGWGMLIIMLVMAVLIGGTTLLNRATAKIAELKKQKDINE